MNEIVLESDSDFRAARRDRSRLAVHGDEAIVTVEDDGMGIPAADLPNVFARFYRAYKSRSQVEGAWLGLSIALWIANVHGASISAESKEEQGSVFRIAFALLAGDTGHNFAASSGTVRASLG